MSCLKYINKINLDLNLDLNLNSSIFFVQFTDSHNLDVIRSAGSIVE